MKIRQPLVLSILVYEVLRNIVLLLLTASLEAIDFISPALMGYLLAPQVIFMFMALFIWIDEPRYRSYIPLYVTGKILELWAGLLWIYSSFETILRAMVMYTGSGRESLMIAFAVLIPLNIGTIIVMGRRMPRRTQRHTPLSMKKPAEDN